MVVIAGTGALPAGGPLFVRLLTPALAVTQDGGVCVGGFHDGVVRPVPAAHIREGVEPVEMVCDVIRVRLPAQQAVDDGDHLGTVDLAVSPRKVPSV